MEISEFILKYDKTFYKILQSLLDWDEKNSIKLPNEISKSISWKYLQSSVKLNNILDYELYL